MHLHRLQIDAHRHDVNPGHRKNPESCICLGCRLRNIINLCNNLISAYIPEHLETLILPLYWLQMGANRSTSHSTSHSLNPEYPLHPE